MTEFLVLPWWIWLAVGFAGFAAGYVGDALLERRRPHWSVLRRQLVAAGLAPAVILTGTAAGMAFVVLTMPDDGWRDLGLTALLTMGAVVALIAFAAGLVGAWLGNRSAAA